MMKLVHDISATVRRSGKVDVLVGVGSPAETLTDVPHSRQMADRVLKVLAKRETEGRAGGGVATVEQVRSEVLLQAVAESGAAAPEMLLRPVRTIAEHDAAQGTSYAETLLAYLGAFGDVMRAAEMLNIHQNTMRYRVRRLQTLFDVDLTKGDQLLATWLQLRLLQIREGEPELPPRAPGG
jgi:DNA-binding PucR family transcriptional regulator